MLKLNLTGEKVIICDVKSSQLGIILNWYNQIEEYGYATGVEKSIKLSELWEKYKEFIERPDIFFACIFRKSDGVNIGIVKGHIIKGNENAVWISTIFILKQYQNSGLGKETFFLIISKLREQENARMVYISVDTGNYKGVEFWHKMGFKTSDKLALNTVVDSISRDIMVMELQI